jgi:hypothetical protein
MICNICKCDWCHSWENCDCDKKVLNPCSSLNCKSFEDFNDYFKVLMKSKRKVKLLLQNNRKTKVIQGTICTVTDDTIFILGDKCSVPTAISISIIKHVMPL